MEDKKSERKKSDNSREEFNIASDSSINESPKNFNNRSRKTKTPRYMRNASIKFLTHPVDKNLAWSFLFSVIFAAISVVTGFPTVIVLLWILGITIGLRMLFGQCCGRRQRRFDIEGQQIQEPCPINRSFVRAPEALWLHDSSFNLHIAHCLFFLEPGLTCCRVQEMVRTRILNRTNDSGAKAFPRFLQKIIPVCSGYYWQDDDAFSLENHIYEEKKDIKSVEDLETHISELMNKPLSFSKPLWEVRLIREFGKAKETVLLIRIHQAVSDAISMIIILCNFFSDNQQVLKLKTRFGSSTFFLNVFRAVFVAPLTFLGWLIWRSRDYNFFNRRHKPQARIVAWSHHIRYSRVLRIKQVMRCSLNDVIVSSVSGAVRAYFTRNGIRNPPNVTLSLPVDLRGEERGVPRMGCEFAQVSVRLPVGTEGAVPRLWEVRRRMEELKTSADTAVWWAAQHCLLAALPESLAHWILDLVLRKATVLLSNVPGPPECVSLGGRRLKRLAYWVSPHSTQLPVAVSVASYGGAMHISVAADRAVLPHPKQLLRDFDTELSRLSHLLARRRIPGEHRRRSHFTDERRLAEIINPPNEELQHKLHTVQEEIHRVTAQLSTAGESGEVSIKPCSVWEAKLLQRLEELKEEFSELMRELRRRKSLADGIMLDTQDEDMDGELRRPRRLTLTSGANRRASLGTMLSLASTTRPLATPTISHHAFVVSTPNLQQVNDVSPNSQQTPSFLQVAQDRLGRRKSDFN